MLPNQAGFSSSLFTLLLVYKHWTLTWELCWSLIHLILSSWVPSIVYTQMDPPIHSACIKYSYVPGTVLSSGSTNEEGRQGPLKADFLEFPVGKTNYKQSFKTYLWKGAVEDISERKIFELRPKWSESSSEVKVWGKNVQEKIWTALRTPRPELCFTRHVESNQVLRQENLEMFEDMWLEQHEWGEKEQKVSIGDHKGWSFLIHILKVNHPWMATLWGSEGERKQEGVRFGTWAL